MKAISIIQGTSPEETTTAPMSAETYTNKWLRPREFNRKKIALPTMEGLCFEKVKHILYLEAQGNYTLLHFEDGRQVLVCRTLCDIEAMLPFETFCRLHRSHTANLKHIKKYVRGKGGYVILNNGASLNISAGQRDTFLKMVEKYFC